MKVVKQGTTTFIDLDRKHFVTAGGEGEIYVKGGEAFKIYLDPRQMIPHNKIEELRAIKRPNVIRPDVILLDGKGKPVGYSMTAVRDTYSLCEILPKTFRDRVNLDIDTVLALIKTMRETIQDCHKAKIFVVDFNEVNFLVAKDFSDVHFIDVDSYQTPSYPATAISPAVRDWHTNGFSELTDWFSFGIVSFEMFIGIHPFKGRHPTIRYPKDKIAELKARMMANIPVFHRDVSFPQVCWPFDVIPQAFKDWYKAIFVDGKRVPPPSEAVEVIVVPVITQTVMGNENFDIRLLFEYDGDVARYVSLNGVRACATTKSFYVQDNPIPQTCNKDIHIGITPTNKVISAYLHRGNLILYNFSDRCVPTHDVRAEQIMSYEGRIFIKEGESLSEIQFVEMGKSLHAVLHIVANVMPQATKLFDGVVIQNVLGNFMASVFPTVGNHYQIKCPEFVGYKIIDAKYSKKVLIVIAEKQGKYDKFVLKFDDKFRNYSIRKVEGVQYTGINFIVLENGVVVHINEDEQIEIFKNDKDSADVRAIDSDIVTGDMRLFVDGMNVLFAKGNKLHRMKMK
jgi:serine/threonine protein kinase